MYAYHRPTEDEYGPPKERGHCFGSITCVCVLFVYWVCLLFLLFQREWPLLVPEREDVVVALVLGQQRAELQCRKQHFYAYLHSQCHSECHFCCRCSR